MIRHDKKDLLWFFVMAAILLVLGSLPYWYGQAAQTDTLLFRGAYFDEGDYAVHISMMRAGRMGDWTYEMRFTTEPHQPAFLRMFYIILGHVSKWIDLSAETTFELARWILGFAALFAIYRLSLRVFPQRSHARFAFALAAFGSGLGWLQLMAGVPLEPISPIDFWLIDAYVFFSLSLFPSFAFMLMLMTAALSLYLDYLQSPNWQRILWISSLPIACQIVNPIAFAVIDAALAGATLFHWWKERKINRAHFIALGVIAIAQIPLLAYNFIILSRYPIWSQFTTQNQTLSPPPSFYFWGFALFWPFAIFGAYHAIRSRSPAWGAILAWTLSGFILAYLPVFIQRRFLLGITIPLGLLAILGLSELLKALSKNQPRILKWESLIAITFISFASMSSIYLGFGSILYVQSHPRDIYYTRDFEAALTWLNENAAPNDFVISAAPSGLLIAQKTDLRVYIGHDMETLYFNNKEAIMETYYKNTAPADWLEQTPVRWVIYGPYEQEISDKFLPGDSLQLAYENETVKVYEVKSR